jgi:hypothetical protein
MRAIPEWVDGVSVPASSGLQWEFRALICIVFRSLHMYFYRIHF